jgi:hypothetical protein
MITPITIWAVAVLLYAIFWLWYVGFRSPLTTQEIDHYLQVLHKNNHYTEIEIESLNDFMRKDTGRSFTMVNSLQLKKSPDQIAGVNPGDSSLKTLINYHRPFMKMMLKRGGIGIYQGRVAGKSFDIIGIQDAEEWGITGINRFRSRRDFVALITSPQFHEKHQLKFAALSKSIAYPVDPWFQLGGLTLVVGLVLALTAALLHIILV